MQAPANGTPSLTILIRPEPAGQHTAQVVGLPELCASAATPEEAVEQVRRLVTKSFAGASWQQMIVPTAPASSALLKGFGHAKDDPTFDQYREEIRKFREAAEDQASGDDETD